MFVLQSFVVFSRSNGNVKIFVNMASNSTQNFDIELPPPDLLKELYKSLYKNTVKTVTKKLKDASTLKSNLINPHDRQGVYTKINVQWCFCQAGPTGRKQQENRSWAKKFAVI